MVYDSFKKVSDLRRHLGPARRRKGKSFGSASLLDRGSIEVFGNNGRVAISRALAPRPHARPFAHRAVGEYSDKVPVDARSRTRLSLERRGRS